MRRLTIPILALLASAPAVAQTSAVPLRDNTPSRDTTLGSSPTAQPPTNGSETAARDPGARERPNGPVAPPAAITSGVQIIAPERK